MVVFRPKSGKLCSTGTAQCHCLANNIWDNLVNGICAQEGRVSAWNHVQAWLVDVDIDLSIFHIFLKATCKYILYFLPCNLYVIFYEQLCVCIDGNSLAPVQLHLQCYSLQYPLIHLSWKPCYLYWWEFGQQMTCLETEKTLTANRFQLKNTNHFKDWSCNKLRKYSAIFPSCESHRWETVS